MNTDKSESAIKAASLQNGEGRGAKERERSSKNRVGHGVELDQGAPGEGQQFYLGEGSPAERRINRV